MLHQKLRKVNKGRKIVVYARVGGTNTTSIYGGQHITARAEDFVNENPWVDHLVKGDAIAVINDLVEGRINDRIVDGGTVDFKDFPLLDPPLLTENNYPAESTYAFSSSGRKTVDYMFSKGCFRKCPFCVAGSNKKTITTIPYETVEKQMHIFKDYGIGEIIVQDDAFIHPEKEHLKKSA